MRGGGLFLIFIGLLLCAAGGGFAWLMWRSFDRASHQRDWAETECTIIETRIEERMIGGEEYGFVITYVYTYGGSVHDSDRYSLRGSPWSGSRAVTDERVGRFPVGEKRTCYVDPQDPSFAVLKLDSKGPGYSLWFPLIFVIGGLGIIVGALKGMLGRHRQDHLQGMQT